VRTRALCCVLAWAAGARAEDSVSVMGNYYYEYQAENTRVIQPTMEFKKDLPAEVEVSEYFLVDQITSASAAFQGGADKVFQEYRKEGGLAVHKRFGRVTPGASIRFSGEPDYQSTTAGTDATIGLRQDTTLVRLIGQIQHDNVGKLGVPTFDKALDAYMGGVHLTQVLRRDLQVGAGLEGSWLEGFQSNPYRRCASGALEVHPERRRRMTALGWGAWHSPTRTTLYASYAFYQDSWQVRAHAGELRMTQRVLAPLELEAYWRPYTQTAVAFIVERSDSRYCTGDPKLGAFASHYVEGVVRVRLPPFWFLREPLIEGAVGRLSQDNRYGDAVLARLGGSFAF
jgi:uncharacterized protein DUF3570